MFAKDFDREAEGLKLSQYLIIHEQDDFVYIFSARSGELISISRKLYSSLAIQAWSEIGSFDIRTLTELQILVPANQNELNHILSENAKQAIISDTLNILLLPSAFCPLGCNLSNYAGYCGQTHKLAQMDPNIVREFELGLAKSIKPNHKHLSISWFGGEPLTGLSAIRKLTRICTEICNRKGLDYSADITTGGTLLSPVIIDECINQLNIKSFSLTLDGPQHIHDLRRPTKKGMPSFQVISNNIDYLVKNFSSSQRAIAIRCNVDKRNIDSVDLLIEYVRDRDWHHEVELYFVPVHPWGDTNGPDQIDTVEFSQRESQWLRRMLDLGFNLSLLPKRKPLVCRTVSSNHTVIGPDGAVHRCSESPLTPSNAKTDTVGLISDGVFMAEEHTWTWNESLSNGSYPCSSCSFLPACGGGCPLSWYRNSDVPCPSYKYNIIARIELFIAMSKRGKSSSTRKKSNREHSPLYLLSELSAKSGKADLSLFASSVDTALSFARQGLVNSALKFLQAARSCMVGYCKVDATYYVLWASYNAAYSYILYRSSEWHDAKEALKEAIDQLSSAKRHDKSLIVCLSQLQLATNLARVYSQYAPEDAILLCNDIRFHLENEASLSIDGVASVSSFRYRSSPLSSFASDFITSVLAIEASLNEETRDRCLL